MRKNFKKLFSVGLFCLSLTLFAQQKPITGQVVDSDGFPVQDAYVYVEGAENGVYTDSEGNYTLNVEPGDKVVVEYIGFDPKVVVVDNGSTFNVELKRGGAVQLDVVEQMGYRKLSKNDQTGSVVQIGSEELSKVPMASVDQALQGKVAGMNITASSGVPGSMQQIRVRGINSINAGTNPLYVIDGVPVNNQNPGIGENQARSSFSPMSLFNSNDVESITVLKDASATAPYGARGANGVILITTKSGKSGKTKFSLSSRYGYQDLANPFPKTLNATQRFELFNQAMENSGFNQAYKDFFTNRFYGDWIKEGKKSYNWGDIVKNKAATLQDYSFTASGGGEKSSFYASLGYNFTDGVVIGSDFERVSAKLNYSREFSDRVKFSTNNNFSTAKQNGLSEQSAYFSNPMLATFFMRPTYAPYNSDGTLNTSMKSPYNPLFIAENDLNLKRMTRLFNTNTLDIELFGGLSFKNVTSFDYILDDGHIYWNPIYGEGQSSNGYVYQSNERNFTWTVQNFLNYSKSIDGIHNFDASLVQEFQKYKYSYLTGSGKNLAEPGRKYIATASAEFEASSSLEDRANLSYLGMFNYNYDKRYVLDATLRREASSKFAKGHRFGTFYSLGLAWNMHNETFLRDIKSINLLKLRASFGKTGNSNIKINQYQKSLYLGGGYNGDPGFYPSQYGNPLLTWEKTANLDVGIDFGVFNNRLTGQITYFDKKTTDMLMELPLSAVSGFPYKYINNGQISNKGFEVELSGKIIQTNDVTFELSGNYTMVQNNVDKLAKDGAGEDLNTITSTRAIVVGKPIYAWYTKTWAGVNEKNGNPMWYVNPNTKPGVTTENYNEAEQVFIGGSAMPTYTGGLSANLKVKGFFANVSFYFSGGNKVYEDWATYTNANNFYSVASFNGVEGLINSWTPKNTKTDWPKMFADYSGNNAQASSTRFLYDGDFIRLRNVQLGYILPSKWSNQIGLDNITLSLTGVNLWTWVKDSRLKYDPEIRPNGFTNLTSPPIKSVTFNVNINF